MVYEELSQPPTYREVIVNAFVFVHKTLHQANERLAKRGGGTMSITPRHYLDFINHYVGNNVVMVQLIIDNFATYVCVWCMCVFVRVCVCACVHADAWV